MEFYFYLRRVHPHTLEYIEYANSWRKIIRSPVIRLSSHHTAIVSSSSVPAIIAITAVTAVTLHRERGQSERK